MNPEIFQVKTHMAMNLALATTTVSLLISLMMFAIYLFLKKSTRTDFIIEIKYTALMLFFFSLFVSTVPFSYVTPLASEVTVIMKFHIIIAVFAMYYFVRLFLFYNKKENLSSSRIFIRAFLIYAFLFTIFGFTTNWLVGNIIGFTANGWALGFGLLFYIGFGVPFFFIIIFGPIQLLHARKYFSDNRWEKIRFTFILIGLFLMIIGSVIEIYKVITDVEWGIGDMSALGIMFLSVFLGLSIIIKLYSFQESNRESEESLKALIKTIKNNIERGLEPVDLLMRSSIDFHFTAEEISQISEHSKNIIIKSVEQTKSQKDILNNFSSLVSGNVQTFSEILESIREQNAKITDFSNYVKEIASLLSQIVDNGKIVSGGVVNINSVINDAENNAKSNQQLILNIGKSIDNILDITQTINKISEDSDILAMNASIESANMGSAGEGFRVVADDLRTLSIQTKDETSKIELILDEIHANMKSGIRSAKDVKIFFNRLSTTVEKVFSFIMTIIDQSNHLKEISQKVETELSALIELSSGSLENSQEQTVLNNQLNDSVTNILYLVESILRSMNQTEYAINQLVQFTSFILEQSSLFENSVQNLKSTFSHIDKTVKQAHHTMQDTPF